MIAPFFFFGQLKRSPSKMHFGSAQIQHLFRIKDVPRQNQVFWFGCVKPPENIAIHVVNVEWNPEMFTIIGVEFTTDLKEITKINL